MFCNLEYVVEAKAILLFINFGGVDVGGLSDDLTQYLETFKWGYVKRGIYAMSCGSFFLFFLSPPISYQLLIFFIFFPLFFFDLKEGGANLWCSKNRESQHTSILSLKRREKRKKCMVCFHVAVFLILSLALSLNSQIHTQTHTAWFPAEIG